MKKRIYRSKAHGQSIPLIAVMLVVLFGFAALAMDVGNVYAEQREIVRATNAAALEGMSKIANDDGATSGAVIDRITASLESNGIDTAATTVAVTFLDSAGSQIGNMSCLNASCAFDTATWNSNRNQIAFVKVDLEGKVDTYFAQLLGQEEFPLNAAAHARSGYCVDGVYPIAVESSLLNTSNYTFAEADSLYSDDIYSGLSQKRLLLRDDLATGSFGFLRWKADTTSDYASQSTLIDALSGAGTLGDAFNEADWPVDNNGDSTVALEITSGYPLVAGELNPNEWIAGADSSLMNQAQVRNAIRDHINNRTLVNLPIYTFVTGEGADTVYYMRDIQQFLIVDEGSDGTGQRYIDLAYIGDAARCASLTTPPASDTLTLSGQVSIYPHYAQGTVLDNPSIQYIVVLDVSGSMIWNFDGVGSQNGVAAQCQGGNSPIQCDSNSPYLGPITERRIAIAYDALGLLADTFRDGVDQAQIVTFSGSNYPFPDEFASTDAEAMANYSRVYDDNGDWIDTAADFRTAISEATLENLSGSARFTTTGATPSAIGLARAREIFSDAANDRDSLGRPYKRAVIFITDGIANVTRDGQINECEGLDCQTGNSDGMLVDGSVQARAPIPAMNDEAADLLNLIEDSDGSIYAIAIGSIGTQALEGVTSNLFETNDPSDIEAALSQIQQEIVYGECIPVALRTTPLLSIPSTSLPTAADYADTWNNGIGLESPEVGIVTLLSSSGIPYEGRMIWDGNGTIRYTITNLPPDEYTMSYWMVYRSPLESNSLVKPLRIYTLATTAPGVNAASTLSVSLRSNSGNYTEEFPITMDLDTTQFDVCASSTP
jgi:hypothetical protein